MLSSGLEYPGSSLCNFCSKSSRNSNCVHCISNTFLAKFVDDSSRARAVNLNEDLTTNEEAPFPLNFHERTGHKLETDVNFLQQDMSDFLSFIEDKKQKVNFSKSTLMLFNFSRKYDFDPRVSIGVNELKVVRTTRVLGITLQDDLRWNSHINDITSRASSKLYLVKRMMNNGFNIEFMIDFFNKEIRSVLEYGAILFHHNLTQSLSEQVEGVQRHFLSLLSGYIGHKFSYSEAKIYFHVEPLLLRRQTLCETFIRKTLKNNVHSHIFQMRNVDRTLPGQRKFQEF